jgi:hypothetical protein
VPAAPPAGKKLLDIKSQAVGTFYIKPGPGQGRLRQGRVARRAGDGGLPDRGDEDLQPDRRRRLRVISEILIANGQFVEFDQVMFRVDPLG